MVTFGNIVCLQESGHNIHKPDPNDACTTDAAAKLPISPLAAELNETQSPPLPPVSLFSSRRGTMDATEIAGCGNDADDDDDGNRYPPSRSSSYPGRGILSPPMSDRY